MEHAPYAQYDAYVEVRKPDRAAEVIRKYLYHWPLFVLTLLICFGLAFSYLKLATPGYTVKARVLIKDDIKGNGAQSALAEVDLFRTRTLVENEIEVLRSRSLIRKVVDDLHLSVRYFELGTYRKKDIYGQSPVRFVQVVPSSYVSEKPQFIDIEVTDDQRYVLKDDESGTDVAFGAVVTNRLGKWKLERVGNSAVFLGKTIRIMVTDAEQVTDAYLNALDAELANKKSTVVELSIKEKVPERGKDILNGVIKSYITAATEDIDNTRRSTLDFIDARLASLTNELSFAEESVESFKSSNGLMDVSTESKFFLDRIRDNDVKLNEVNVQLEIVNGIEKYIDSNKATGNAPATAGIADAGLVALINQLITLELQKDQLLGTTPAKSPVFETINRQIATTKHSIRENIRGLKTSLTASQAQLRKFSANLETSIRKLPGQERELITKKRQQNIKEELYVYLLQKREEADVSYATATVDNIMVDPPFAGQADSPKAMLVMGLALMASLCIPFGIIFGRDLFNNKIQTVREVQDSMPIPILGELIYQRSPSAIVMQNKSGQLIAEQFRSLNTNLQHIFRDKKQGRVTLLTSGMSGEGKSFIATNLAASLAASGRRTIILEFDLRNPMIARNMRIKPRKGLADYLVGNASVKDIVIGTNIHKNLFVALAGTLPEYPTELLQRPGLHELIDWVTGNFDEILIDTPPVQLVADAMILAEFSDINIYVLRQGVTQRSHLDYVRQIYADKRLKNLSIVFNGVDSTKQGNRYDYSYYGNKYTSRSEAIADGMSNFLKRF